MSTSMAARTPAMAANACPVCGGAGLPIDRRGAVPVAQNVVFPDRETARRCAVGSLELIGCGSCGFVWNATYDPALIRYDDRYNNDVTRSAYYVAHMTAMAHRVLAAAPDAPLHVVEIGCGQGDFLSLLLELGCDRIVSATGYDPSSRSSAARDPRIDIRARYFTRAEARKLPGETNVVVCRHAIEYFTDTREFLCTVASAVTSGAGRIFIETPSVEWILAHGALEDFNYERCSLFSTDALATALRFCGLSGDIESVYDGQYLWATAQRRSTARQDGTARTHLTSLQRYAESREARIALWTERVDAARTRGPVAVWGAAAKGVMFASLLADSPVGFDCAIDLNEAKQGAFLALTGLPIVSPAEAMARGVRTAIVMNPNYAAEIRELCDRMNWAVEIVPLH